MTRAPIWRDAETKPREEWPPKTWPPEKPPREMWPPDEWPPPKWPPEERPPPERPPEAWPAEADVAAKANTTAMAILLFMGCLSGESSSSGSRESRPWQLQKVTPRPTREVTCPWPARYCGGHPLTMQSDPAIGERDVLRADS